MSVPVQRQTPPWLLPLLLILLVCSGVCALIYQVLWLRLLALTFGVTVHAAATVLGSFMGGLAIGSLLAGRMADRSANPLRLFGLVEIGIGVVALLSPLTLAGVEQLFLAIAPSLPDSVLVGSLVRTVLSFIVLLAPTALMGATMPVVVKSSLSRIEALGTRVSLMYAANTTGAICGAMLAGFYLIPRIGLSKGFLVAAALNITIGLVAMLAARFVQTGPAAATHVTATAPAESTPLPAGGWMVLLVSGISGFASLALEVVWFRLLAIFQGPTSYTFTVVLATVLAGIALGSAVAAPVMRLRRVDWVQALAALQFVGAGIVLASFSGIVMPGEVPWPLPGLLSRLGAGFAEPAVGMSLGVVLPAALFFGMSFPIGLRLWAGADGLGTETGRRVGLFYSVNVGGGIMGSLLAGFVLLPLLGSRGSLLFLAGLYVLGGIGLQLTIARTRPLFTGLMAAGLVALVLQSKAVPDPLDIIHRRIYTGRPVIWQEEGMQTTVAVVGGMLNRVLFLDGRHQANDSDSMAFIHRRIGLLPVVLHGQPKRALVVGMGGGASPGAMSQYPGLNVDVVELSEGVIKAGEYFSHINFDILRNPSVRLLVDDGRSVLQSVRDPYDVITADAIIPRHAGANSLNSVEYFTLVRNALAPGGIALHWNGGATQEEYKLIMRAFVAAFPHTTLWGDGTLMVGTLTPLTVSQARIAAMLENPETRDVLQMMHIEEPGHLEKMFRADTDAVRAFLGTGTVLSDDRPLLEYFASLPQDEKDLSGLVRRSDRVIRP